MIQSGGYRRGLSHTRSAGRIIGIRNASFSLPEDFEADATVWALCTKNNLVGSDCFYWFAVGPLWLAFATTVYWVFFRRKKSDATMRRCPNNHHPKRVHFSLWKDILTKITRLAALLPRDDQLPCRLCSSDKVPTEMAAQLSSISSITYLDALTKVTLLLSFKITCSHSFSFSDGAISLFV